MKLKNVAYITVICVMIFSVLGTAVVFAPPQSPLLPAPIGVINPPDSTLEVSTPEGQSFDVTLDEPISVITDEGDSLEVEVNNFPENVAVVNDVGSSLDVAVNNFPDNVAVINDEGSSLDVDVNNFPSSIAVNNFPSSINVENGLDVSGWLHTTESGHQTWVSLASSTHDQLSIDAEGYREVTVVFDCSEDSVLFEVAWLTDGQLHFAESDDYGTLHSDTGGSTRYFFKTYQIKGQTMIIYWGPTTVPVSEISLTYYITT